MDLQTPIYNLHEYSEVYEPSEDTFLFIDALEAEQQFIRSLQPQRAVEIGSGSGVVITALASILRNSCTYFATDINSQACKATQLTGTLNNTAIQCINADLLSCFRFNCFDIVLFNPPYVLTDDEEVSGTGLSRAWAGGRDGRLIIDKLLLDLSSLLTSEGVCYMVLLNENKPQEIVYVLRRHQMDGRQVLERRIIGEHLFVYKFFKTT